MKKERSEASKVHSKLTKDLNRMKKVINSQTRMNILRKYQLNLLDKFMKKLLKEGRITKEEIGEYMPKKEDSAKRLFGGKRQKK